MFATSNEIHLWFANYNSTEYLELLYSYHDLLDREEAGQYSRFHFDEHKTQYLVTRALIRNVLSLYYPIVKPSEWKFEKSSKGKPYIKLQSSERFVNFNISHTNSMIVVAISFRNAIGVDIEYLLRPSAPLHIADHWFDHKEISSLNLLSSQEKIVRFYELWTLKEAFIKATGDGLQFPLDAVSFDFSKKPQLNVSFDDKSIDPNRWCFWHAKIGNEYGVSIALYDSDLHRNYVFKMFDAVPHKYYASVHFPLLYYS